ncbi:MAG TPA: AAA family ATPase, partial [Candidatus Caenarcaniphilales bacterium]
MYIKHLELSHFKSFGGTTQIPLLPGFTVVSGPNGSGKSNILDALLFALGLSGSKGMRAERLPDLVNHTQSTRGHSIAEASVTVTFDLTNAGEFQPGAEDTQETGESSKAVAEWQVTRKLRVTQQGTYTSNYYINGQSCTLHELHEQLNRLRIYPEGYNVVLQGDVTSIISMNSRQRREIIDELAGVADFDRKIMQATEKLDTVKQREDRFRIVETELMRDRERLDRDRAVAAKYQQLRTAIQEKSQWEAVLLWRDTQAALRQLAQQLEAGQQAEAELITQHTALQTEVLQLSAELERLNTQVKALGEAEHLAVQSALASASAELRQLERQQQELEQIQQATTTQILQTQQHLQEQTHLLAQLQQQQTAETQSLVG